MAAQYTIESLRARTILDSRGYPTVEVDLRMLGSDAIVRAAVPSGASVGSKEALELRDGGRPWQGKGVTKAIDNVNKVIAPIIIGRAFGSLAELDTYLIELDGSPNKSRLGANAILAVSMAFAKGMACSSGVPLYALFGGARKMPIPYCNVINGGAHADNALDIQEFMIVPHGVDSFARKMQAASEVFHVLKKLLHQKSLSTNVGDEGGFAPNIGSAKAALDLILQAIEKAGYQAGQQIAIALDVAATEVYQEGRYILKGEDLSLDAHGMAHYLEELCKNYPICSIEDPMHEGDYEGWRLITALLGKTHQIVGDDVFVTNVALIEQGIKNNIANAVLIKPNQIGTLTETIQAVQMAHKHGYHTMVSHRSGETEDVTIAHLAVGLGSGQIKSGSLSRTDRLCKYNELLRIEEEL